VKGLSSKLLHFLLATISFSAAKEAFLAKLVLDAKKNTNKEEIQGSGKSKDKRKKKVHRKAKGFEVCITSFVMFLFTIANVVLYIQCII
jgi:hypothetical protein